MADITPSVYTWSVIETGNAPLGPAIAGGGIDDNLRAIQAGVKKAVATIGADIPVGATIDLANATGNTVNITGTGSSISSLGNVPAGAKFTLIFQAANTLVNSSNLVLPGGTNIAMSAGDIYEFLSRGSSAWTCVGAQPNSAPGGLPIGAPIVWLTSTPPPGFVLAFGQTLNRTIYASLFAVYGTSYNVGGEAGTDFRIPDMRGRFVAGLDNMGGTAAGRIQAYATATTVGGAGGNEQPHQHAHTASSASSGSPHSHSFSGTASGTTDTQSTDHYHSYSGNTGGQSADHTHTVTSGVAFAFGSGGDPAATNGIQSGGTSNDHFHSYSGNTASQSSTGFPNYQHAHNLSIGVSGSIGSTNLAHNHTVTVDNAGSGASGNLPPVMFVNWAIRAF